MPVGYTVKDGLRFGRFVSAVGCLAIHWDNARVDGLLQIINRMRPVFFFEGQELNQADLRRLAQERIQDASALLAGGRWSFAYYVAGYAVECALKSCILSQMIHTGWIFESKVKIDQVLTHDFAELVELAGLKTQLNVRLAASAAAATAAGGPAGGIFVGYWGTVLQWDVASRYQTKTEAEAREIYEAITHAPDGIMQWIQNFW